MTLEAHRAERYQQINLLAKDCVTHALNHIQPQPPGDSLHIPFDVEALRTARDEGRRAIRPHIAAFMDAARPTTLPDGGEGVRCGKIDAKCAHGLAFELAAALLAAIDAGEPTDFLDARALRNLYVAIGSEHNRIRSTKANKRQRRTEWVAECMLLVQDHPDWSDSKIARKVGLDKSTLSRCREYRIAATMARGEKSDRSAGFLKRASDGGGRAGRQLEAVEFCDPADLEDDEYDSRRRHDEESEFEEGSYLDELCGDDADAGDPEWD